MGIGCTHRVRDLVWGLTSLNEIFSSRLVYLLHPPFVYTTNEASQELLCCGLVPASGCIVFVAPWGWFLSRPRPDTAFDCLELPSGNYKVIHRRS